MDDPDNSQRYPTQLRLMLEDLCSDLCRFEQADKDGFSPQRIQINREQHLGAPGAFADILVRPFDAPPYAVEIKFGYGSATLVKHLRRKYSTSSGHTCRLVSSTRRRWHRWPGNAWRDRHSAPPGSQSAESQGSFRLVSSGTNGKPAAQRGSVVRRGGGDKGPADSIESVDSDDAMSKVTAWQGKEEVCSA